jgi:hypothetical protein
MFLLPSTTTRLLHWQSVLRGQVWKGKQDDPTRKKHEDSVYTAASQLLNKENHRPNSGLSACCSFRKKQHASGEDLILMLFFMCALAVLV